MNVDLATVCYAREKLEFIKQSPNDLITEVHDTNDVCCDNKEEVWGASPPKRWYDYTNFSPPYLKVLQTPLATYQRLI